MPGVTKVIATCLPATWPINDAASWPTGTDWIRTLRSRTRECGRLSSLVATPSRLCRAGTYIPSGAGSVARIAISCRRPFAPERISSTVKEMYRSETVVSEAAVLVGVVLPNAPHPADPLDELNGLAETAGAASSGNHPAPRSARHHDIPGQGEGRRAEPADRGHGRRRGGLRQRSVAGPDAQSGKGHRASKCSIAPS